MTQHDTDALQEAIDGRLSSAAQEALAAHLADCDTCRAEYERLGSVKAAVASLDDNLPVPAGLDTRIREVLDREDERSRASPRGSRQARGEGSRWRWRSIMALAAGVMLVTGVGVWRLSRVGGEDAAVALATDFASYRGGKLRLGVTTADPLRIEAFLGQTALGFPVRVIDLGMMGYRLVGGQRATVGDRPAALMIYRSGDGRIVMCAMYQGDASTAAPRSERRTRNGIEFFMQRLAGTTVVFWQEGAVACALISDAAADAVFELAVGKAMRAA